MVPLARYRPDIPYVLVTAEFVRVRTIAKESIEDRSYHLCPRWVGAWLAVYRKLREGASVPVVWPSIQDLEREGDFLAESLNLETIPDLVSTLQRDRVQ